ECRGAFASRSADVLEVLARLEADGPAWRNAHLLAGAGVTPDSALPRLHLEDAEAAQFYALAPLHRGPHGIEHGVHGDFRLDLGDVGKPGHFVDDVDLDHVRGLLESPNYYRLLDLHCQGKGGWRMPVRGLPVVVLA